MSIASVVSGRFSPQKRRQQQAPSSKIAAALRGNRRRRTLVGTESDLAELARLNRENEAARVARPEVIFEHAEKKHAEEEEEYVLLLNGRRIPRKKKRQCVKCE